MKLSDILALRPAADDSATIRASIAKVEAARAEAINRAGSIERDMRASLLTATDAQMQHAERDAATAKLAADRLEMLLGELRPALDAALAREAADVAAVRRDEAIALDAAFVATWRENLPKILDLCGAVLEAKRAADQAFPGAVERSELPRLEEPDLAFVRDVYRPDPLAWVLKLAEQAPAEIQRRREEAAEFDRREHARRVREAEHQQRRAADWRAAQEAEQAEDRKRQEQARLGEMPRSVVTINGVPATQMVGGGW
ncbi:MAG: hypothetical protein J0H67_08435 [Rhodospirillales bacterium]|nr:hypothetical protein [Rhodospirillales bacterium]MBN8899872.1 hypothetical protein [Rhodospirillales bacterium]